MNLDDFDFDLYVFVDEDLVIEEGGVDRGLRILVFIRGREVDIIDIGIDLEFL